MPSTNEIKSGTKLIIDSDPCTVVENEYVKPGKGQAFNRIKFKNLKTMKVLERTWKSGDNIPAADVVDVDVQYLYSDTAFYYFLSQETFEQYMISQAHIGEASKWIKPDDICIATLFNNEPINLVPPIFVKLKVVDTEPGIRGDTVSGGTKTAKLETGAIVRVPLFVNVGDILKIDTRTGSYISRE